jgi:hypothetical protein
MFNVGDAINSISVKVCESKLIKTIFSNSIITSLLLTTLFYIVISLFFKNKSMTKCGNNISVKVFIYFLIISISILSLHQCTLRSQIIEEQKCERLKSDFDSIDHSSVPKNDEKSAEITNL